MSKISKNKQNKDQTRDVTPLLADLVKGSKGNAENILLITESLETHKRKISNLEEQHSELAKRIEATNGTISVLFAYIKKQSALMSDSLKDICEDEFLEEIIDTGHNVVNLTARVLEALGKVRSDIDSIKNSQN